MINKKSMFLKSIKINNDIILDSNRESQKKFFKIKKRTYTKENKRKPIYKSDSYKRVGYEKEKVTERTFIIHKKDFELEFKNPTIIVGDNGCGKTHLINFLKPTYNRGFYFTEEEKKLAFKKWLSNNTYTLKFIKHPNFFLHGKEIHKNSFIENFKNQKTTLEVDEVLHMFFMQDSSNGENVLDFLNSLKTISDSLIILDEPETSLSLKSQVYIKKLFTQLLKQNNQIILITHSPILMELSNQVYDFEVLEYVDVKTYINNQLNGK